jgi:hypothetical protein
MSEKQEKNACYQFLIIASAFSAAEDASAVAGRGSSDNLFPQEVYQQPQSATMTTTVRNSVFNNMDRQTLAATDVIRNRPFAGLQ